MSEEACDVAWGPLSARISSTEEHERRIVCGILEICKQTTHLQALPLTSKSFSSL